MNNFEKKDIEDSNSWPFVEAKNYYEKGKLKLRKREK